MIKLVLLAMFFQTPIPPPVDRGVDVTHKKSHDRTIFYTKDKIPCGQILEFRNGSWYGYVYKFQNRSQAFTTRKEATTWLRISCSVEGKLEVK